MKKIGIVTSGGDAPGMNAAIRAAVRYGIYLGMEVYGIERGYTGLINDTIEPLNMRSVSDIIQRGGTILKTARCPEFKEKEGQDKAIEIIKKRGLEGIIVIGGDGSFRGARDLTGAGIPCIGIPGTIDNDIAASEYTIGFDTALNTAVEMVDRLRDTMESHDRCSVVQVMGRRCGDIALETGIAVGATSILVPEIPYDFQHDIVDRMTLTQKTGKMHFIIVVAEGVGGVEQLAEKIEKATGIETRATVLGHVQRGGSPTLRDRVVGSQMGALAAKLLYEGSSNRVIVMRGGKIVDLDITEALNMKRVFDKDLYATALRISI